MNNTQYKIGVKIDADASRATGEIKRFDDAVGKLGKNAQSGGGISSFTNSIQEGADSLSGFIGPAAAVVTSIAAIGTAAVAGGKMFFDLVKGASDFGSKIKDFQDKTGLAVDTIQALKLNLESSGLELENFQKPLNSITKLVYDSSKGNEKASETLHKFGVTASDTADGALQKILKKIYETKDETQKLGLAMEIGGTKGAGAIRALAENVQGDLSGMIKRAKELGIVLSQEDVNAADNFGDTLHLLGVQAESVGAKFLLKFAPQMTEGMNQVSEAFARNQDNIQKWGDGIASTISRSISLIQGLVGDIQWASNKIDEFSKKLGIDNSKGVPIGSGFSDVENPTWLGKKLNQYLNKKITDNLAANGVGYGGIGLGDTGNNAGGVGGRASVRPGEDEGGGGGGSRSRNSAASIAKRFELSSQGKALVEAANKLGISPIDLAAIISYETSGTFSPSIKGGKGGNYQGLIQFGAAERAQFGVKAGQSFEEQILGPVVKYFQTRFASVGRSTTGASLMDLYKTVNGGNPNVSSNASDGNGTIATHVQNIAAKHIPNALNKFFGGSKANAKGLDASEIARLNLAEFQKGLDLLDKYQDQFSRLNITTVEGNALLELQDERYANLDPKIREAVLQKARQIDQDKLASKATADYTSFLDTLAGQYDTVIGVEKTALNELNERITALKEAGVILDEYGISQAKYKALIIDIDKSERKLNEAIEDGNRALRERREAEGKNGIGISSPGAQTRNRIVAKPPALKGRGAFGTTGKSFADSLGVGRVIKEVDDLGKETQRLQTNADILKETYAELGAEGADVISSMAGGVGDLTNQWVLYGSAGPDAMRKMTASVLAGVASQAAVKSIFQLAEGFASLFWNPAEAAAHFQSAALFGSIALGAGLAGRGVAGNAFSGSSSQSNSPDYMTTNSSNIQSTNQNLITNNSARQSDISMLSNAVNGLEQKISGMPPGDVVVVGLKSNPSAASSAMLKDIKSNATTKNELGRAMGLG